MTKPSAVQVALAKRLNLPATASKTEVCRAAFRKLSAMGAKVGDRIYVDHYIPGSPTGLPTDTEAEIVEISKGRGSPARYKVKTSAGNTYWINEGDIA